MDLKKLIQEFIEGKIQEKEFIQFNQYSVKESLIAQEIDKKYIYNEISFQHELGEYLRRRLEKENYIVQFERNINDFGYRNTSQKKNFAKKEMDIVILNKQNTKNNYIIELKYHSKKNTRYHDTTADCIKDIRFVNDIVNTKKEQENRTQMNFKKGYCVTIVEDKQFYTKSNREKSYNYYCFRNIEDNFKTKEVNYSGRKKDIIEVEDLIQKSYLPIREQENKDTSNWKSIYKDSEAKYYIIEIEKE